MWLHEATVRNVNRALREVQAFDLEGDYRPAARAALKRILEEGGRGGSGSPHGLEAV